MGIKNAKGTVSIENFRGRIRIRWRYQTKRYSINLNEFKKNNLLAARKTAVQIEQDIVNNAFDFTLSKYSNLKVTPLATSKTIVEYFEEWVTNYRQMDCNKNCDYYFIRNTIKKWSVFNEGDLLKNLNNESFSAKTYNSRLSILRKFAAWMVKKNIWSINPLEDVSSKKTKKTIKANRKPFTEEEIKNVLAAFKNDTYCLKNARYKHSHYYPFIYFIFKLGVRNAEAVGLRVSSIDYLNKQIHIKEILARTVNGTHAAARVRKETKNGKERYLPLTEDLNNLLKPVCIGKKVFSLHKLHFKNTCQKSSAVFVHGFSFATVHLNSDATLIALSEDRGCAIKKHLLHLQPPARVIGSSIHSQYLRL